MEIQTTLLQGLTQALTGGQPQAQRAPSPEPTDLSLSVDQTAPGRVLPTEQTFDSAAVDTVENRPGMLSNGEQEILNLLFNDQDTSVETIYGPQVPKPAVLGNFVDVRG
ncbi:MAG: hypothetical protein JSW54_08800 [Fidelibacterota bacterium]|nr:MAG: hypothetical protein JSW54_08800 [Candidatus Neomarinimicrobiota bacterium]